MKYTTTSLLMSALLGASGFAAAQNPTAPAARADVKSEIVRPGTGTPPTSLSEPPKPGTTSGTIRAEMKSDVVRPDASTLPRNLSEPPKPGSTSNTTCSAAKAGVYRSDRELSTGEKAPALKPTAGYAKRKAMRDERRAMNKSGKGKTMKDSSSATPAPEAPMNK